MSELASRCYALVVNLLVVEVELVLLVLLVLLVEVEVVVVVPKRVNWLLNAMF